MSVQLSIRNLTKRYKTGEGVTDISLDVKKGELVTLLGPSGCGKTTVLRSIGGFLEPDSGEIMIASRNVVKLPPEKRPTSMVFQGYNLWPHMSIYENLAFGLKIRKTPKAEIKSAVEDALRLVRLPGVEKKFPSQLSGGQQQRIAVARSLLLKPEVLLLDEPFSALDAKLRHEMREELREIQTETGLTMVFVTHDQEEALSLSDRIVVMNQGNIEQIAAPQDIYDSPDTLFVAQFIGKMNFLEGVVEEDKLRVGGLVFPNTKRLAGSIVIAVRPEDVIMGPGSGEEDGLYGTIKQLMVLGHYAEVSIELDGYGTIRAFQPRDTVKELSMGQRVTVAFAKVIAYPNK
ncbi:putative spermidine/putrescine transport system ATP-binding protein [Paenibacillus sophorae]|uniref:Carnitine transport ATP-binding protein OpuCA n=1 Tax=Paenibacillus sophorae TaxID=1333845 RepID=A0A1H8RYA6_9BACL|nr:ABC transporter ATP-binding protein [Paenibacillus sophorae]QWU16918.1 ABC transporter ATP-binding protein [Paenibacillus sophorae]SEO71421.1 putative spermidine/putrescine transport system ATP-binding protein [Paenibacillus sophorae]